MKLKSSIFSILVLTSCSLEHEVSRVTLPDTGLSVVVSEDEKSLYRCRIFLQEKSSDGRICGHRESVPRDARLPDPVITRSGDVATIDWLGASVQVKIDVVRRAIVDDPNLSR